MKKIKEISYVLSYKELKEKLGITEQIVFIKSAHWMGGKTPSGSYEEDYGILIGIKEEETYENTTKTLGL